jgi:hypothetical protein
MSHACNATTLFLALYSTIPIKIICSKSVQVLSLNSPSVAKYCMVNDYMYHQK